MRKFLTATVIGACAFTVSAPAAWACGGLVAPNGAVRLLRTTTLAAYHDGIEHYLTSFQFEGGGARFGSIIPLPGVPTSVSKGGSWTLQRLEREVNPPIDHGFGIAASATAGRAATVILQTTVDALDITVLKGDGPAVVSWIRAHGFAVSPDAPAVLDFYARRSPVFLTATYDQAAAQTRGLGLGDGTPVQLTIPTANPWVPLRILALGKDPDDVVQADVFLLTDNVPKVLTGSGVDLAQSEPATGGLLDDLRSDQRMGWVPTASWLTYFKVRSPSSQLRYDMAIDASGGGQPSPVAAGLVAGSPASQLLPASADLSAWDWTGISLLLVGTLFVLGIVLRRERALSF